MRLEPREHTVGICKSSLAGCFACSWRWQVVEKAHNAPIQCIEGIGGSSVLASCAMHHLVKIWTVDTVGKLNLLRILNHRIRELDETDWHDHSSAPTVIHKHPAVFLDERNACRLRVGRQWTVPSALINIRRLLMEESFCSTLWNRLTSMPLK